MTDVRVMADAEKNYRVMADADSMVDTGERSGQCGETGGDGAVTTIGTEALRRCVARLRR